MRSFRVPQSPRSTHPADGEEQTLQVRELCRRKAEEARRPVGYGTRGALVPRERIYIRALVSR